MTAESGQTIVSITQWFPSFHAMTFCVHMHAKSCQKFFIFQQILELCPIQLQHQSLAYPFTGIPEHRQASSECPPLRIYRTKGFTGATKSWIET